MEPFDEVDSLVDAVARVWSHLRHPEESLERTVLLHLRRVEAARAEGATGDAEAVDLLSALQAHPAIAATVMGELEGTVTREFSLPPIPGAEKHERYLEIPILYATDRAPAEPGARDPFTGARGTPSYGVARVSVPDDHRMGALEKPRLWKLQFRPDPAKHVALLGTDQLTQDAFTQRGSEAVRVSAAPEALLFVHGYNVTFADAARRAAQIAYDLQFDGLPMLYSWPSEGTTLRYPTDEENSLWTRPHFADFLRLALGRLGTRRLHLLAHSMGNRVVTQGLADLTPAESAGLGHVVFAAPDVDAAIFTQLAAQFLKRANRYTLYASSNDLALKASQRLARYPRAGQSGPAIVVIDGLDTIDASRLDTGLMSHSYFGDRTSILSDLFSLIRNDLEPAKRFGLTAHENGYWAFLPTAS
ncbi:alpha/beta hydrolase [Paractinoplanes lichenicola]|uniref:Alpha/beta hydrolase n=1 Tax=Paractinoplanes lichenicola TaxID=2802976 RepID=A0ABS1W628_9ACTN|nr:alpha/beta hydrolase [Actinoplanes lichenicola]MBL7262192.1 alpha/beta hydrolase [Actinoplanes lichenicola]